MLIQLEMGSQYRQTVRQTTSMGRAIAAACSRGLGLGGQLAAGKVVSDHLSGQSLKRRSGTLAREVDSWMAGDAEVVVGVPDNSPADKYKWLLGDEQMTIRPKSGKFLAIPIGEGLTSSGVPRFGSPREVEGGFFLRSKSGALLFGRKRGTRGKFRPLFVLKKSVFVQGSGALYDGVMDSLDDMAGAMQTEIDKVPGVKK